MKRYWIDLKIPPLNEDNYPFSRNYNPISNPVKITSTSNDTFLIFEENTILNTKSVKFIFEYYPTSNVWSKKKVDGMPYIEGHKAVKKNKKIFIISRKPELNICVYDINTKKLEKVEKKFNLSQFRALTLAVTKTGIALATKANHYIFDTDTNSLSNIAKCGGRLLDSGAGNETKILSIIDFDKDKYVYSYDSTSKKKWTVKHKIPIHDAARINANDTHQLYHKQKLIFLSCQNQKIYIYDMKNNQWTTSSINLPGKDKFYGIIMPHPSAKRNTSIVHGFVRQFEYSSDYIIIPRVVRDLIHLYENENLQTYFLHVVSHKKHLKININTLFG